MAFLDVYWNGDLCGRLETTSGKGIVFTYDECWKRPVSMSLPVRKEPFSEAACLPFFSGLLPDGQIRFQIAAARHVSYTSVFRLLQQYGGDVAGALSLCEDPPSDETSAYSDISEHEIAERIRESSVTPIILQGKARLSLAGAQQKLPIHRENDSWKLPLGNAPSSVIIKPSSIYAQNEFLSNRLAWLCGLHVPAMSFAFFEDQSALVIERFDRENISGRMVRVHQEDFCQALGVMPEDKYEADGGPGFGMCLNLIETSSSSPLEDSASFRRAAVFNFLIGNCDAHGKNFSFLYPSDGSIRLAPFYDLIDTALYPELDRHTAMKYGKERRLDRIAAGDIVKIGSSKLMKTAMEEMADKIPSAFTDLEDSLDDSFSEFFEAYRCDVLGRRARIASI